MRNGQADRNPSLIRLRDGAIQWAVTDIEHQSRGRDVMPVFLQVHAWADSIGTSFV